MSVTSRSPLRLAGANVNSGNVNTGELNWTQGGQQIWGFSSGGLLSPGSGFAASPPTGTIVKTQDQILIFSGAGRLNWVQPHQAISGVAVFLYDSATVARSGANPNESGYPTLGVIPANTIGLSPLLGGGVLPIQFGTPFHSGLCVSAVSGTPGCTISFTPETNLSNPG